MKKVIPTLVFLLAVVTAYANPVDKAAAAKVAGNLLQKQVVDATPDSFTECYLFVGTDGTGFALIAADDCVPLLLGYSLQGTFPVDRPLPHHIDTWLKAYQYDIDATAKAGIKAVKYNTPRDTAVGPLLTTTWNQAPLYNWQCPYSVADSDYAVTGCVATAMAQVMKYWNHPAVGRGSHSYTPSGFSSQTAVFDTTHYDWAHMPNALGFGSTEVEINAVAQLMYHAGVAVEMMYSTYSSGAYSSSGGNPDLACAENALKDYFRYNQALFSASREDYSDADWDVLLTTELNAARPIFYSGHDNDGGHAFVIDGYDTRGLYHVNWGWGGYCDGYYTFDNLSPTGSGIGGNHSNSYSYENQVLINVFPASEASTVTVSVVPSDPLLGTVTGGGSFAPYTTTTLHATATEGHRFLMWKKGNRYNPFTFSPNNDYTDTALFAPIYGDTLSYCFSSNQVNLWGESAQTTPEWGIRIPPNSIPARRQLKQLQFYGVSQAEYTVKVYVGANFDLMAFSANKSTTGFDWYTVTIPDAIPLIDSLPLWIVLTSHSYVNPAVLSGYSGNPDGSWYKRAGSSWEHLEDRNEYGSWMIRAILEELEQVAVTVESNNPNRGEVSGGGLYFPGDTALLEATPAPGYRFVRWSTGARTNPYHHRVTTAETITATFTATEGIDEVDSNVPTVIQNGLEVSISNPQGLGLSLYDIQGRQLAISQRSTFNFQLPAPGVYLLRCGDYSKKIVAIR